MLIFSIATWDGIFDDNWTSSFLADSTWVDKETSFVLNESMAKKSKIKFQKRSWKKIKEESISKLKNFKKEIDLPSSSFAVAEAAFASILVPC